MSRNYNHYENDLSTFTSLQNMQSTLHSLTNTPYNYDHDHDHQLPILDFTHQSYNSSLSCNNSSTSDEAEEINHMSIINERKRRRMISNRESARRSRMRKQKQLDELCAQLLRLSNENYGLVKKFEDFLETHEKVVQENDGLKKEIMEIKELLNGVQITGSVYNTKVQQIEGDDDDDLHGDGDDQELISCTTSSGSFNLIP